MTGPKLGRDPPSESSSLADRRPTDKGPVSKPGRTARSLRSVLPFG